MRLVFGVGVVVGVYFDIGDDVCVDIGFGLGIGSNIYKEETLHKVASFLAYTGTKQIPQVSHIRLYQVMTPSKDSHISSRTPTILTNLIMISTKATSLTEWELRVIVIHNPNLQQQVHHSIHKHFGAAKTVSRFRVRLCTLSTMRTPSKEKGKAPQMRAVEDIVFSTEMAALDFKPTLEEEIFLQLIGLDRFVTRVIWEIVNIPVIQEVITNLNLDTMESVLNGQPFSIFPKD